MTGSKKEVYFERLLDVSLWSLGAFPILPNKLKPLPVVLLLLLSICGAFSNLKSKIDTKSLVLPILFSSLIVLYLISFLYSENLKVASGRLETCTSLFLMPFVAFFVCNKFNITVERLKVCYQVYFFSATIYSIIIICFFWHIGYYNGENTLEYSLSNLDGMLTGYSQHPIYASIILAIAMLSFPYVFKSNKRMISLLNIIGFLLIGYVLLLLFRKGVLIALLLSMGAYVYKNRAIIKRSYLLITASVLIVIGFVFKENFSNRFIEVFEQTSYQKVDLENSTSIRFAIYNCTIDQIMKSPIIGHGVGDGYEVIASCLDDVYNVTFSHNKQKKNSHNQYLGIWLYVGALGILLFVTQLILYWRMAIKSDDYLFLPLTLFFCLVMLTENILDRQTGVLLYALFMNLLFFAQYAASMKSASND